MIKNVSTIASEISTVEGGTCCVPIAWRKNEKTMTRRKKLVIIKMSEGASARAVRISKTFREFTSCSAFCGEFRLKFIVGSAGSAPKTTQNKTAKLSSAFTTNSSYQGYFS